MFEVLARSPARQMSTQLVTRDEIRGRHRIPNMREATHQRAVPIRYVDSGVQAPKPAETPRLTKGFQQSLGHQPMPRDRPAGGARQTITHVGVDPDEYRQPPTHGAATRNGRTPNTQDGCENGPLAHVVTLEDRPSRQFAGALVVY